MTPKEKSIAFIQSFIDEGFLPAAARIAALVAVDEIINIACDESDYDISVTETYWQEVKQEIENL